MLAMLDARTKVILALTLAWICVSTTSVLLLASIGSVLLTFLWKQETLLTTIRSLRRVVWFVVIITSVRLFSDSGQIIFSVGDVYATREGLTAGLLLSLKIILLFLTSRLLMLSTPLQDFLDAMEAMLGGSHRGNHAFLALSLGAGFIPLFIRSAEQIKRAQIARGAFHSSLVSRVRRVAAATLPLFVGAFRSSLHLADAIDSRGFDPSIPRSPFYETKLQLPDWFLIALSAVAAFWQTFSQ